MNIGAVISAVNQLTNRLDQRSLTCVIEKTPYEKIFKNIRLQNVRFRVSKKVFQYFLSNYIKSLSYTYI